MTEPTMHWHMYAVENPDVGFAMIVIGPSPVGCEEQAESGQMPCEMSFHSEFADRDAPWLASFAGRAPSEAEKWALTPEKYRSVQRVRKVTDRDLAEISESRPIALIRNLGRPE